MVWFCATAQKRLYLSSDQLFYTYHSHIKLGQCPLLCMLHDSPVRSANKRVSSLQGLGIFSRHPEVSWKQNEITMINFMCCGFIGMEDTLAFPIITSVHKDGRKACIVSSRWSTCKPSELPLFPTFQSFIKSPVPDDNHCLPGCIMTLCLRNVNHRGN